jgi:hypothetical protein
VLQFLKDGNDVRKGDWAPKEVCSFPFPFLQSFLYDPFI